MLAEIYPGAIQLGGPNSGLLMEIGSSSFSGVYTDATDIPIRTGLDEIVVAMAAVSDTYSPATDATMTQYVLFVNKTVASNAVSVHRSSQAAVSGLPFDYILIGRKYATS